MAGFVPNFYGFRTLTTIMHVDHPPVLLDLFQNKPLLEFQSHVHFEKTGSTEWARVSYLREKPEAKESHIFDIIDYVTRATIGIEAGVHRLQQLGRCCHKLVFLRQRLNPKTGSRETNSILSIEAASVRLSVLRIFLEILQQQRSNLLELSCEAWKYEQSPLLGYRGPVLSSIGIALATGSLGLLFFPPTAVFGAAIYTAYTAYKSSTKKNDASRRKLLELLPLTAAIGPILATLGIPCPDMSKDSALDLLHCVALTIQFLALVIQSYARPFTAPMEFSFLDHLVSNFILEGASFGDDQSKIFAMPQSLSCLGDMIGSHVLVFGTDTSQVEQPVDVEITAADLIEIWGPAKLAIVHKV
jgi:hypothetical protein